MEHTSTCLVHFRSHILRKRNVTLWKMIKTVPAKNTEMKWQTWLVKVTPKKFCLYSKSKEPQAFDRRGTSDAACKKGVPQNANIRVGRFVQMKKQRIKPKKSDLYFKNTKTSWKNIWYTTQKRCDDNPFLYPLRSPLR